jgi:hypothetical protein
MAEGVKVQAGRWWWHEHDLTMILGLCLAASEIHQGMQGRIYLFNMIAATEAVL